MRLASTVLRGLIRGYQVVLSPVLPSGCRFDPSCSAYAFEAVGRFGALHGGWLALKRIGRCHPWGGCGHDPVPPLLPGPGGLPGTGGARGHGTHPPVR